MAKRVIYVEGVPGQKPHNDYVREQFEAGRVTLEFKTPQNFQVWMWLEEAFEKKWLKGGLSMLASLPASILIVDEEGNLVTAVQAQMGVPMHTFIEFVKAS